MNGFLKDIMLILKDKEKDSLLVQLLKGRLLHGFKVSVGQIGQLQRHVFLPIVFDDSL